MESGGVFNPLLRSVQEAGGFWGVIVPNVVGKGWWMQKGEHKSYIESRGVFILLLQSIAESRRYGLDLRVCKVIRA